MADAINKRELMIVMTDVNPYMVGSVIISKGKPVIAHSCNLTGQPRHTTTKNESSPSLQGCEINPKSLSNIVF